MLRSVTVTTPTTEVLHLEPLTQETTPEVLARVLGMFKASGPYPGERHIWILEKPVPYIAGAGGMGATSAFTLGFGYGQLLGVLRAARQEYREVDPKTWMKGMPLPPQRADRKERLVQMAMERWPDAPWPARKGARSGPADACWIADWWMRTGAKLSQV